MCDPDHIQVRLDGDSRLASDVPCVRCGYNLRGLDPNGPCPECGTAVGRSLQGDFLQFRDPEWVESLASGMNWIVWGIVWRIVVGIAGFLLVMLLFATKAGTLGPLGLLLPVAGQIVSFVGYWKVTTPEPASLEKQDEWNARKVARLGAVIQVIGDPLIQALAGWLGSIPMLPVLLQIALWIVNMVGYFAIMIYARRMALRIPDEKLARHTRIVMWGLIIPVVSVIFGIWALHLIGVYRRRLREAARLARATWATEPAGDAAPRSMQGPA